MKPTFYYIRVTEAEVLECTSFEYQYTSDVVFPTRQMALVALHTTLRKNHQFHANRIEELIQQATRVEKELQDLMDQQAAEEIHE